MSDLENSKIISGSSFDTGSKIPWVMIILIVLIVGVAIVIFGRLGKKSEVVGTEKLGAKYLPELSGNVPAPKIVQKAEEFNENYEFNDGLGNPDNIQRFELDEDGTGLASIETFNVDINGDGIKDKITKSRFENGTAHFHYDYKIELNLDGQFTDITPAGFRTVEGADCSLQKLRFSFYPDFQVIKISRDWEDTWVTPTMATKTIYRLKDNKLEIASTSALKKICNVSDLF
ncbi:MAG: hypothetical protein FWE50_00685 [Alphaproteobacteria bacterium]|nr:hypothetical protein [Alphaproteobacteria bacterium]